MRVERRPYQKFLASLFAAGFLAVFLPGCQSYDVVQSNVFSDEDGNIVQVDYGRSESEHVNYFRSPTTGEEMPFKSKLVIYVTLPDGDTFTAWQCMNFLNTGTMYRTDNDRWMFLANGFSCIAYEQDERDETRYLEVYRGILCETPKTEFKESDKWRKLKKDAAGKWN